jgi:hypothetical protein
MSTDSRAATISHCCERHMIQRQTGQPYSGDCAGIDGVAVGETLDLDAIQKRAERLDGRDYGNTADRLLQVDVPALIAEVRSMAREILRTHARLTEVTRQRDEAREARGVYLNQRDEAREALAEIRAAHEEAEI